MSEDWTQWEGRIIDETYPLQRYLGAGEQSVVFQTEDADHGREPAAIKLLPAETRDPEVQLSQWQRAAQLAHPNLIGLRHSGRGSLDETDVLYAVMEYAEEDMGKVLQERPLSEDEVGDMVEPVLSALVYLHGEGLAHAQLKPSNILAAGDQLKISCDGVCRPGTTGRPASKYDPPEFESAGPSPAGDIWSFGVTLVEALTQQLPEQVQPETLPAKFRDTVTSCLHEDPRQRPTVQELAAKFRPLPAMSTPVASPVVRPVTPPPPVRPSVPAPIREPEPVRGFEPAEPSGRPRYLLPVAAVGLAAVAIFAATKLTRGPEPAPGGAPPVAIEAPAEKTPAAANPAPKVEGADRSMPTRTAPAPAPRSKGSSPATATAGEVLHEVLPDVDAKARRTIRGKVKVGVRVSVDAAGRVTKARFESAGPSRYLAGLSEKAARQWKFRPATVDGREVPSEWLVRFEITRSGTVARATRASR